MDGLDGLNNSATPAPDASPAPDLSVGAGPADMSALSGLANPGAGLAPQIAPQQPAPAPAQASAPAPDTTPGSHGRLVNMLQGLFLGMDSFAKAAATGGQQGGAQEVLNIRNQQKMQNIQEQQQANNNKELDMRMKYQQAQTNALIAQTQVNMHNAPLEHQKLVIENNQALLKMYTDLGINPIFAVKMLPGQGTDEHMSAINSKANGDLVNNTVIPAHDDTFGGDGTSVGMAFDQLRKITIPQEALMGPMQKLQNQIDMGKATLGEDDPSIKTAQAQLDLVSKAPSINGYDFYVLDNTIQAKIMSKVQNKQAIAKMQEEQNKVAQGTDSPEKAQSILSAAQADYKTNPTPDNKARVDKAKTALSDQINLQQGKIYAETKNKLDATNDSQDAQAQTLADTILKVQKTYPTNKTGLLDLLSARQPLLEKTWQILADKGYDPEQIKSDLKYYNEYRDPNSPTGKMRVSGNQLAVHAADAIQEGREKLWGKISTASATTLGTVMNTAIGKLEENHGGTDFIGYKALVSAARQDYDDMTAAGYKPGEDLQRDMKKLADPDTRTPNQVEVTLKKFAKVNEIRLGEKAGDFKEQLGYYPPTFTPRALAAYDNMGMKADADKYRPGGKYAPAQVGQPQAQSQPSTPGANPSAPSWSAKQWLQAHPGGDVNAATQAAKASGRNVVD